MSLRIDRTRRRGFSVDHFPFTRVTIVYAFGRRFELRRA